MEILWGVSTVGVLNWTWPIYLRPLLEKKGVSGPATRCEYLCRLGFSIFDFFFLGGGGGGEAGNLLTPKKRWEKKKEFAATRVAMIWATR